MAIKSKKKWSRKYKKSINCKKPKGFSQKQYCKYGKNKRKTRKTRRRKGGVEPTKLNLNINDANDNMLYVPVVNREYKSEPLGANNDLATIRSDGKTPVIEPSFNFDEIALKATNGIKSHHPSGGKSKKRIRKHNR